MAEGISGGLINTFVLYVFYFLLFLVILPSYALINTLIHSISNK